MNAATQDRLHRRPDKTLSRLLSRMKHSLCLLVAFLTCSCTIPAASTLPIPDSGDFTLFLQPVPQEAHRLSFVIGELVARRDDGSDIRLKASPSTFPSDRLPTEQQQLASITLPPGYYLGLKLQIESATLTGEEGQINLLPPAKPILVETPFTIHKKQMLTLFLSLSADKMVTHGAFFTPQFSLWKPKRTLSNLKGYVSNSDAKSLTIFNKRDAQIIGLVRVGDGPMDLVLDQRKSWVYVALSKENSIVAIDINTDEITGQVRLRAGDEPTELALSTDGERLLTVNRGSNSVSIIDTGSLSEMGRIKLDAPANDLLLSPDGKRAYTIHSAASLISMIDIDLLQVRTSSTLGDLLIRGAISTDGRTLYIITDFSADLLVVDSSSLTVQRTIDVGYGARSIKLDDATGLLYVGKNNGEIAVVDPRVLMAIDSFRLPGPVQSITIDREENSIFAVLPQSRRLVKIDLLSKRQSATLELGSGSHTVVVMLER